MQQLIEEAIRFLKGKVRKTPVELCPLLSKEHPVYFKLEFLQITGSFKVRGALFALKDAKQHVLACSAGNHGLGIAYAAKQLKIPCTIFVPVNVDRAKNERMKQLGATVRKSEYVGYDDTLEWAKEEAEKMGAPLLTAFDDEKIMAGNGGTLAAEVYDELPKCTTFVLPVGGGGLAGGFSYYMKEKNPKARIVCCQHAESPALKLSLERGEAVTYMPSIETLAGGLEGGLGAKCFEVLKSRVDEVALVSEDEIKRGVRWMLERHQYLIEPCAGAPLVACLFEDVKITGPTVIVLTGRNVGIDTIKRLI